MQLGWLLLCLAPPLACLIPQCPFWWVVLGLSSLQPRGGGIGGQGECQICTRHSWQIFPPAAGHIFWQRTLFHGLSSDTPCVSHHCWWWAFKWVAMWVPRLHFDSYLWCRIACRTLLPGRLTHWWTLQFLPQPYSRLWCIGSLCCGHRVFLIIPRAPCIFNPTVLTLPPMMFVITQDLQWLKKMSQCLLVFERSDWCDLLT